MTDRQRTEPPAGSAYDVAVRILAARAHSARELRQKLLRRRHPVDEVDQALERLRGAGYLDDAAYARSLIGRRAASRGARAIAAELTAKGVDRETARAALGDLDPDEELRAAIEVARRLQKTGASDAERIGAKLLRRGFAVPTARAALRALQL